jgi:transglutaminase-like putative cysteine protease
MKYQITHITRYSYGEASPVCHNVVRLMPRNDGRQRVIEHRLVIAPESSDLGRRVDYFGNQLRFFAIQTAHRGLSLSATSIVQVTAPDPLDPAAVPAWEAVRESVCRDTSRQGIAARQFLYQSPRVCPSQALADYARPSFPPGRPLVQAVADLTARIHADFRYDPKATTVETPVEQVLECRRGVCQDFAHLQIGCLRSLGLAARYVSGYLRTRPPPGKPRLVGADATHAWLSVHCGRLGWIDFDPTNNLIAGGEHIVLAYGRDYSDVTPVCGVFTGGGSHTLSVSVDVADFTGAVL